METRIPDNKIKAYVPIPTTDINQFYFQLLGVLKSAKIEIISAEQDISQAHCAIHLIGNSYKKSTLGFDISDEEYWFNLSCEQNQENPSFRIFIWHPTQLSNIIESDKQVTFINSIRQNLIQNMTFCSQESPVMFVEDIRSIVFEEQQTKYETKKTDVFFIYNEIDEDNGNNIVELLTDVVKVECLNISLRSETDYSEFIAQQIKKSYLTTIYFNRTANWAVPFTQQVWKKIGGASANKEILMIGDSDFDLNKDIVFKAPNVTNLCAGTELIPLETKVFYDRIFNEKSNG